MLHPIQRIHACSAGTPRIFTATSNVLHVFEASTGNLLSSWTAPIVSPQGVLAKNDHSYSDDEGDDAPKSKKRKVAETSTSPTTTPTTTTTKKGKGGVRVSRLTATEGGSNNAISVLLTTEEGAHLVVATSEDKAVRVFAVADGRLELLSTRALPKRVGGLALLKQGTTLVAADKHGDVFTMPLLVSADDTATDSTKSQSPAGSGQLPAGPGRDAEAARRRARTEIDFNLTYEHKFILGHVSMLLCVLPVSLPANHPTASGKEKHWIITADRDEHIRVTRFPQTFVIDQFLLGHEAFVAQLLAPAWNPVCLVSGGGDSYLLEWDWFAGRLVQKLDLAAQVQAGLAKSGLAVPDDFKIACNGLWQLPHPAAKGVLVGVEKVPALFVFTASGPSGELVYADQIPLPGNLLDVATIAAENRMLVAMAPLLGQATLLQAYEFVDAFGTWKLAEHSVVKSVDNAIATVNVPEHLEQAVTANVLYPVSTLRKEFLEGDRRNPGKGRTAAGQEGEGGEAEMEE